MFIPDFKPTLQRNKLLLPDQPYHDDFLHAMQKVFQCSCLIGVLGTKKYISYVWSFILLCALLFIEVNAIWKVIKALAGWAIDIVGHRSVAARFAGTLFYSISIISLILSSRLSLSWHNFAAAWAKTESSMALNVPVDKTIKIRMYIITGLMLTFSLTEHIMSIVSQIGLNCPPNLILKRYVLLSHGFMILRHEYSEWFAFPLLFIATIASLLWNFQDLIIVLISIGLTSRYHRLNKYLLKVCVQEKHLREYNILVNTEDDGEFSELTLQFWDVLLCGVWASAVVVKDASRAIERASIWWPPINNATGVIAIQNPLFLTLLRIFSFMFLFNKASFDAILVFWIMLKSIFRLTNASLRMYTWRKLREAYVKQALLVRRMDKALGGIIILSCVCNFYFICLQLFLGITQGPSSSPIKKVYYIVSLAWLCIRVTSVILAASAINVHSQLALKHIYTYETRGYNIEVERLQDQLSKDYVALSGMGFFYLNKTILLQMAGAIITYELMLIQFDNKGTENTESIHLNTTIF